MPLDLGTTIALFAFLVGLPVGLFFTSNLTERYEKKIARVMNGLYGSLEQPLQNLRDLPVIANHSGEQSQLPAEGETETIPLIHHSSERDQYQNHQQFMNFVEGHLLDKFNDYHDMLTIQKRFESNTNKILLKTTLFVIPGLLVQLGDPITFALAILVFYILSLLVMGDIGRLYRDISTINRAYGDYVIEDTLFGNYDY